MVATRASNHRNLKSNYYTTTDIGIFLSHYTIVRAMVNENHSVIVCLFDKVSNLNPKITRLLLLTAYQRYFIVQRRRLGLKAIISHPGA